MWRESKPLVQQLDESERHAATVASSQHKFIYPLLLSAYYVPLNRVSVGV